MSDPSGDGPTTTTVHKTAADSDQKKSRSVELVNASPMTCREILERVCGHQTGLTVGIRLYATEEPNGQQND